MVRDVAIFRASQSLLSALTISLSPENRCLLSPLSFYQIPLLQELFFLKWSSAFLYCLFFKCCMHPPSPRSYFPFISHFVLVTRFFLYTYGRVSLKCISAFLLKINPLPFRPVASFCTFFWSQFKKEKRSESFLLSLKF